MAAHVPVAEVGFPEAVEGLAAQGAENEVEEGILRSLCEHLRSVTDVRSAHGKVHCLDAVLSLVVVALLVGQVGLSCAIAFAVGHGARRRYNGANRERLRRQRGGEQKAPSPWLQTIGLQWRGRATAPALQTLISILGRIRPRELQEAMAAWVAETLVSLRATRYVASVDGKAMKAAGKHILSVFVHDLALVALHEEVGEKKNELSTLRDRVAWLVERYPGLWLLCGDAMFADATLCQLLNHNGRHWLFQVKANQPNLLEKLEIVFSALLRSEPHYSMEPEKKGSTSSSVTSGSSPGTAKSSPCPA